MGNELELHHTWALNFSQWDPQPSPLIWLKAKVPARAQGEKLLTPLFSEMDFVHWTVLPPAVPRPQMKWQAAPVSWVSWICRGWERLRHCGKAETISPVGTAGTAETCRPSWEEANLGTQGVKPLTRQTRLPTPATCSWASAATLVAVSQLRSYPVVPTSLKPY